MLSFSTMRRTSLADGRSFKSSNSHTIGHTKSKFWAEKMPSLQHWRLHFVMKSDLMLKTQNLGAEKEFFWLGSSDLVFWKVTERLANWGDLIICIHKKGDRRECTSGAPLSLASLEKWKCVEKRCPEIIERKQENTQCGFRSGLGTTYQIFTPKQSFEKSWQYNVDVYTSFIDLEKARPGSWGKAVGNVTGVRRWRPPVTSREVIAFLLWSLFPWRQG